MSEQTAENPLDQPKLQKLEQLVRDRVGAIRSHYAEIAKELAQLSHVEKAKFKTMVGDVMNAETVERLYLVGKGKMPLWLATQPKLMSASKFSGLDDECYARLANPKNVVEVFVAKKGVRVKPVGQLTGFEMGLVFGSKGIRTVTQQEEIIKNLQDAGKNPAKRGRKRKYKKVYDATAMHVDPNDPKYIIINARNLDEEGDELIGLRIQADTLKKLLG